MDANTQITERVGVHKTALIFLEELKWLEREQPISDFGIDMHVEIVENGIPNGLLFALQIKSGPSYIKTNSNNTSIIYYGELKHLDYWTNHSLPVILVIYDTDEEVAYWEFVNEQTIQLTDKSWKIEISKENVLSKHSIENLKKYYYDSNNYIILSTQDTSHGLSRRVSAKVLVKNKPTKSTLYDFIPSITNKMKEDDYYRNQAVEAQYKGKKADCVWIYFYNNLLQYKNGLPFCIAVWNSHDSESPTTLPKYDDYIDDIGIQWNNKSIISDSFLQENRLNKGPFLKIIDNFVDKTKTIFEEINIIYNDYKLEKISFNSLTKNILTKEANFEILLPEEFHQNYPPYECTDLNQEILNLEGHINNIFLILKNEDNTENNKTYLINLYLTSYKDTLQKFIFERNKVT